MAIWRATYINDIGLSLPHVGLEVFNVLDGEKSKTPRLWDEGVIPPILKTAISSDKPLCFFPPSAGLPRHARAYLGEGFYAVIPCPFVPNTDLFHQFYQELLSNSTFRVVEHHGESVGEFYLDASLKSYGS